MDRSKDDLWGKFWKWVPTANKLLTRGWACTCQTTDNSLKLQWIFGHPPSPCHVRDKWVSSQLPHQHKYFQKHVSLSSKYVTVKCLYNIELKTYRYICAIPIHPDNKNASSRQVNIYWSKSTLCQCGNGGVCYLKLGVVYSIIKTNKWSCYTTTSLHWLDGAASVYIRWVQS